jgi:uncharacterized membrane protein
MNIGEEMPNLNYCPQCGHKITNEVKFCPDCGHRLGFNAKDNNHQVNNKRDKVLAGSNNSKKGKYFGLASVILIGALIFYVTAKPSKEEAVIKEQPKVTDNVTYPASRTDHSYSVAFAQNGKIILPLDIVKEKKFVKFDYVASNATVPLLAYLTEDGKVVTAISLCEPCDSKSFHIKGSNLICNSCGTTWDLNNLDALSGSCGKYPPDPVPSKIVGNEIQIDEYIVANWTRRN